ncbi:MAG: LysE family translocator [Phycisphaerales bacterium]|nr:LysE family translocator [Phycisphaerales bacterium]
MFVDHYFSFVFAAITLILIPGPTNLVVLTTGINFGFSRSLWAVAGAAFSHACLLIVASMGLAAVLAVSAVAFECIRWVGVAYLIWLGLRQWWQADIDHTKGSTRERSAVQHLLEGFLTNTTNPKALLFYGAFFPPFIKPDQSFASQFALLGVTFVSIFIVVAVIHGYVGSRLSRIPGKGFRRWQRRVSGSFLVGSGLLLATTERS